jgi:hypothetical protein
VLLLLRLCYGGQGGRRGIGGRQVWVPRPRLDERQPRLLSGLDGITVELSTLLKRRGFNESNRGDPPASLFFLRRWMCI